MRNVLAAMLLVGGIATGCQDTSPSPATWRVGELHDNIGLVGGHQDLECLDCHGEVAIKPVPSQCEDCHGEQYGTVAEPDHVERGFPTQCADCHNSNAWRPALFAHEDFGFALLGAHANLVCAECHPVGQADSSLSKDCYACHETDFVESVEPSHMALQLSQLCTDCHDTQAWSPASFDHDSTDFALTGAHIETSCSACHTPDVLTQAPTDCYACHETDYNDADPDHLALELGTQCLDCHTSADWRSDVFDHERTAFALRGAHAEVTCVTCHAEGFSATSTDCITCHATDEPQNHFGPDCSACHTDVAWIPSTFDHEPSFPLLRGNHRDYQDDCAACHMDPADYNVFTCTDCHDGEHERRETDDDHDDVRDYRYESAACYDCHPSGDEDDAEDDDDDDDDD